MLSISRRDFLKAGGVAAGAALLCPQAVEAAPASPDVVNNYVAMLYDATICVGCNACTNACRQWNHTTVEKDPSGLYDAPKELSAKTWTLIQLYKDEKQFSFVKRQCMHCVDPACVSGCPVHALQKTPEGPVIYDKDRCIGCRYCMYTCPYHIPRFQWDEVIPVIAKCTLCYDRIKAGNGPACAERCPTGALVWGKRSNLLAEAHQRLDESPKRYVQHVFGEDDAGGASVIYLADVSFDKLGFPNLKSEPIPKLSEATSNVVLPAIVVGGPLVLAAVHWLVKHGGLEDEP